MSTGAATRAGTNLDVLMNIMAVGNLSSPDLFHCLLTSSTFFHAAAPALYHTLPISHACFPLEGATKFTKTSRARPPSTVTSPHSPYCKDKLLQLVRKVLLEYTRFSPGHTKQYWDTGFLCYPLPNVWAVIVEPQDTNPLFTQSSPLSWPLVMCLCMGATHIFMGPYTYSRDSFGDAEIYIPPLPMLKTVCLSVPVDEADNAAALLEHCIESQSSHTFTELHLYLWDDITFIDDPLSLSPEYTSFSTASLESLKLQTTQNILPFASWSEELASLLSVCGYWTWTKSVSVYGLPEIVERYKAITASDERFTKIDLNFFDTFIKKAADDRKAASGSDAASLPERPTPLAFHSAEEMYKKNWSGVWAEGEERYYEHVVKPSDELVALREIAAETTGQPVVTFLTLCLSELRHVLYLTENPPSEMEGGSLPPKGWDQLHWDDDDLNLPVEDESDPSSDEEASEDEFLKPWAKGVPWTARSAELQVEGMDLDYEGYEMEDVDGVYVEEERNMRVGEMG
ncbi:hypothetical protein L202_08157 [Cryptococcus amylolentus CBS 6039]|uniref:Uncharacterized protein n=1 Tax=Cryptococcus amylolentus CBS 6039 TaxID=1295533 RepID=A0A1E3H8Q8_9TREE|nr:hypothetical protein L202_08157 [Cryptococcus amylolentus CBS 6039]ODN72719.1 hypothetical protein L202_08157 [Cryptococcus amylolentus CBS 6039]